MHTPQMVRLNFSGVSGILGAICFAAADVQGPPLVVHLEVTDDTLMFSVELGCKADAIDGSVALFTLTGPDGFRDEGPGQAGYNGRIFNVEQSGTYTCSVSGDLGSRGEASINVDVIEPTPVSPDEEGLGFPDQDIPLFVTLDEISRENGTATLLCTCSSVDHYVAMFILTDGQGDTVDSGPGQHDSDGREFVVAVNGTYTCEVSSDTGRSGEASIFVDL